MAIVKAGTIDISGTDAEQCHDLSVVTFIRTIDGKPFFSRHTANHVRKVFSSLFVSFLVHVVELFVFRSAGL